MSAHPTLNPSQAPQSQEYAGDEINALVLDPGANTIRAGFAGEDIPKSVIPSFYGVHQPTNGEQKLFFGENTIHNPISHMEIKNPFDEESLIDDWDTATKLFEYAITSRLTGAPQTAPSKNGLNDANGDQDGDVDMDKIVDALEKPMEESPLLMSEPAWNPTKSREKTMEMAFESWGAPAFWMGRTGMLSAFASGKPVALVIDVGANQTSVTPVIDGFFTKKATQRSPLGSNWLSNQIRLQFAQMNPTVPLIPHYQVKSKQQVDAGQPSNATYMQFATPPTDSFRRLQEERVLTSFKESMVQVWSGPGRLDATDPSGAHLNLEAARSHPPRPFEMPDGWNQVFGIERFRVAEGLFDAKAALRDPSGPPPEDKHTIPALVSAALSAVDVDQRAALLNQVVLTGAGSLVERLPERIQQELTTLYPNPRVRVHTTGSATDRKFGAWIGGSVLASLGTFHQMWISKKEYEEHGASIVEKRCK
ncbi:Actin/actin-like protein [Myriangium duriaei CBS 260.36]|uniref:Actin/actin-like protein n=1 Tax=Myriangium duriaei CBS 260.36 TaxID=1168546 RepID=A0A9P4MHD2_9PEZI|nr:Actin/actin-like protein [Myriangium duriaei CBS 260.36]